MTSPFEDDFDDDLTVGVGGEPPSSPAPFISNAPLDAFDDDFTQPMVVASVEHPEATRPPVDDFDDEATVAARVVRSAAAPKAPAAWESSLPTEVEQDPTVFGLPPVVSAERVPPKSELTGAANVPTRSLRAGPPKSVKGIAEGSWSPPSGASIAPSVGAGDARWSSAVLLLVISLTAALVVGVGLYILLGGNTHDSPSSIESSLLAVRTSGSQILASGF